MAYCLPRKKIKIETEFLNAANWINSVVVRRPLTLNQYLETRKVQEQLSRLVYLYRATQKKGTKYKNKRQIDKLFKVAFIKLGEIQSYFRPIYRYKKIIHSRRGRPNKDKIEELIQLSKQQHKVNTQMFMGEPCNQHPNNKYCMRYTLSYHCVEAMRLRTKLYREYKNGRF